MTTLVLIRHGRSVANARGILAGRSEGVELDGAGREQAYRLGDLLAGVRFAAVYTSPMLRCRQTAALAGLRHAVVDDRLTECDYGRWTNRPLAELAAEPIWAQVQAEPSGVVFPDGESMAAMRDRVVGAVRELAARHGDGDVVAVVGHGDPIKAILSHALGQGFDDFQRIVVAPASLSVVDLPASGAAAVRCMNAGTDVAALLTAAGSPQLGGGDSPAGRQ